MRLITLLSFLLVVGCVNVEATRSSAALNQVDAVEEARVVDPSEPSTITAPDGIEIDEEILDLPTGYYTDCVCEYVGWHEDGMICVGMKCTNECSAEVASCNEQRRACVPDV